MTKANSSSRGFTLVELIIVLSLVSIVFFIAIPNYNSFRRRQSAASAARDFQYEMQKLRRLCQTRERAVHVAFKPPVYYYFHPITGQDTKRDLGKIYNGVDVNPDGGTWLDFDPGGNIDAAGTNLTRHAPGANEAGYYKVIFSNGHDATYEVWIFDDGSTKLVQV